ncbi:hypothetical protein ACFOSS_02180 [Pseudaeromonas sharmana]|uniref:Inhibitor of glucose uptake transporter SgrT n=1 Tax=Pseudaeromonas sharmana TaxID=328412 RepID=A0ABV8CK39_9GAMM
MKRANRQQQLHFFHLWLGLNGSGLARENLARLEQLMQWHALQLPDALYRRHF